MSLEVVFLHVGGRKVSTMMVPAVTSCEGTRLSPNPPKGDLDEKPHIDGPHGHSATRSFSKGRRPLEGELHPVAPSKPLRDMSKRAAPSEAVWPDAVDEARRVYNRPVRKQGTVDARGFDSAAEVRSST